MIGFTDRGRALLQPKGPSTPRSSGVPSRSWLRVQSVYDSALPRSLKALAAYLAHRANRGGVAWPAVATMARESGLSKRQVQRDLKRLTALGVLVPLTGQKGGPPGSTVHYAIAFDVLAALPPQAREEGCQSDGDGCHPDTRSNNMKRKNKNQREEPEHGGLEETQPDPVVGAQAPQQETHTTSDTVPQSKPTDAEVTISRDRLYTFGLRGKNLEEVAQLVPLQAVDDAIRYANRGRKGPGWIVARLRNVARGTFATETYTARGPRRTMPAGHSEVCSCEECFAVIDPMMVFS